MQTRRMLLVDGEPIIHTVIPKLIAGEWQCEHASSGEEAIKILEANPYGFDILLSDLVRPGLNGEDFIREVRRRNEFLPIVYLTGGNAPIPAGYGAILKPAKAPYLNTCLDLLMKDEIFIVLVSGDADLEATLEQSQIRAVVASDVDELMRYRLACRDRLRLVVCDAATSREIRNRWPALSRLLIYDNEDAILNLWKFRKDEHCLARPMDSGFLARVARQMATTFNPL